MRSRNYGLTRLNISNQDNSFRRTQRARKNGTDLKEKTRILGNNDLEDVARHYAYTFYGTTGIEHEELLQEAYLAAWLAATDGSYEPEASSLKTYASRCVFNKLCTVSTQARRKHPTTDELDPQMAGAQPSPEDVACFRELLRQLPDDAKLVVRMILEDAGAVAGLAPTKVKLALAEALNWPRARLREAFTAISKALAGDMRRV